MNKPRTGKIINCKHCNKEFYIPKNRFATALYCSLKCKALSAVEQITTTCKICGSIFQHKSSRANHAKYCSRKCYYKAMSSIGSIKKICPCCNNEFQTSPSRNRVYCSLKCRGIGKRVDTFKTNVGVRKALIRRNLLNKCADCGYDEVKEILGVHHIDHNHNNNNLSNLVVLCPNCHSLKHLKHTPH